MRYIIDVEHAFIEQHLYFIEATGICNKMLSDKSVIRAMYLPVFQLLPSNENMTLDQMCHLLQNVGDVSLTIEAGNSDDLQMKAVYGENGQVNRVEVGRQFSENACSVAPNVRDNAKFVILVGLLREAAHVRPLVNLFLHLPAGQITPESDPGNSAERMLFNSGTLGGVLQDFGNLFLVRLINANLPAQLVTEHRKILPTANVTAIMSGLRGWAEKSTFWNWCLPRTAPLTYFQQNANFQLLHDAPLLQLAPPPEPPAPSGTISAVDPAFAAPKKTELREGGFRWSNVPNIRV